MVIVLMGEILAVIPARAGSKRLPGKNKRVLGGKPLIMWSVDLAKKIPQICDVVVSTDDEDIAEMCRIGGATVPWLRPAELASDTASTVDVVLHLLDWYELEHESPKGILLLQPTSPFRRLGTVVRGIETFNELHKSVVGVSPCNDHPMWSLMINNEQLQPFMKEHGLGKRSQDLPAAYTVNGAFYLLTPQQLRDDRSFAIDGASPLVMPGKEQGLDIDDEQDWLIAEALLAFNKSLAGVNIK